MITALGLLVVAGCAASGSSPSLAPQGARHTQNIAGALPGNVADAGARRVAELRRRRQKRRRLPRAKKSERSRRKVADERLDAGAIAQRVRPLGDLHRDAERSDDRDRRRVRRQERGVGSRRVPRAVRSPRVHQQERLLHQSDHERREDAARASEEAQQRHRHRDVVRRDRARPRDGVGGVPDVQAAAGRNRRPGSRQPRRRA